MKPIEIDMRSPSRGADRALATSEHLLRIIRVKQKGGGIFE